MLIELRPCIGALLYDNTRIKTFFYCKPVFVHWDILVVFLTVVLKLTITVFISLYFQTFWPKWLTFFSHFKRISAYDWKKNSYKLTKFQIFMLKSNNPITVPWVGQWLYFCTKCSGFVYDLDCMLMNENLVVFCFSHCQGKNSTSKTKHVTNQAMTWSMVLSACVSIPIASTHVALSLVA